MQIHARNENGKRLIWDVERLKRLASGLRVHEVAVDSIRELDQQTWFGENLRLEPTCREVAKHAKRIMEAELSMPIILSSDGSVMDGMHRVARAWIEGRDSVKAVRFEVDPEPDRVFSTSG